MDIHLNPTDLKQLKQGKTCYIISKGIAYAIKGNHKSKVARQIARLKNQLKALEVEARKENNADKRGDKHTAIPEN